MTDGKPLGKETQLLCAYSAAVQIADYGQTDFNMGVLM